MKRQKNSILVIEEVNCLFRCLSYCIFSTLKNVIIIKFITDLWDNSKECSYGEGVYDILISN